MALCVRPVGETLSEEVNTNGQPSGVAFDPKSGRMYIADLAHGAIVMRKDGGQLQLVAKEYEGVPFKVGGALPSLPRVSPGLRSPVALRLHCYISSCTLSQAEGVRCVCRTHAAVSRPRLADATVYTHSLLFPRSLALLWRCSWLTTISLTSSGSLGAEWTPHTLAIPTLFVVT